MAVLGGRPKHQAGGVPNLKGDDTLVSARDNTLYNKRKSPRSWPPHASCCHFSSRIQSSLCVYTLLDRSLLLKVFRDITQVPRRQILTSDWNFTANRKQIHNIAPAKTSNRQKNTFMVAIMVGRVKSSCEPGREIPGQFRRGWQRVLDASAPLFHIVGHCHQDRSKALQLR